MDMTVSMSKLQSRQRSYEYVRRNTRADSGGIRGALTDASQHDSSKPARQLTTQTSTASNDSSWSAPSDSSVGSSFAPSIRSQRQHDFTRWDSSEQERRQSSQYSDTKRQSVASHATQRANKQRSSAAQAGSLVRHGRVSENIEEELLSDDQSDIIPRQSAPRQSATPSQASGKPRASVSSSKQSIKSSSPVKKKIKSKEYKKSTDKLYEDDDARDIIDDAVDRAIRLFFGKKGAKSKKQSLTKHKSEPQLFHVSKQASVTASERHPHDDDYDEEIIRYNDNDKKLEHTVFDQRRPTSAYGESIGAPSNRSYLLSPPPRSSTLSPYGAGSRVSRPSIYSSLPNVNKPLKAWRLYDSSDADDPHQPVKPRTATSTASATPPLQKQYSSDMDQSTIVKLVTPPSTLVSPCLSPATSLPANKAPSKSRQVNNAPTISRGSVTRVLCASEPDVSRWRECPPLQVATTASSVSGASDTRDKIITLRLHSPDDLRSPSPSVHTTSYLSPLSLPHTSSLLDSTQLTPDNQPANNLVVAEIQGAKLYATKPDSQLGKSDMLNMYVFNKSERDSISQTLSLTDPQSRDHVDAGSSQPTFSVPSNSEHKHVQTSAEYKRNSSTRKPLPKLKPIVKDIKPLNLEAVYRKEESVSSTPDMLLSDIGVQTDGEELEQAPTASHTHTYTTQTIIRPETPVRFPEVTIHVPIKESEHKEIRAVKKEIKVEQPAVTVKEEKEQKYSVEIREEVEFQVQRTTTGAGQSNKTTSVENLLSLADKNMLYDLTADTKKHSLVSKQPSQAEQKPVVSTSQPTAAAANTHQLPRHSSSTSKHASRRFRTHKTIYLSDNTDNQSEDDCGSDVDMVSDASQAPSKLSVFRNAISQPLSSKPNFKPIEKKITLPTNNAPLKSDNEKKWLDVSTSQTVSYATRSMSTAPAPVREYTQHNTSIASTAPHVITNKPHSTRQGPDEALYSTMTFKPFLSQASQRGSYSRNYVNGGAVSDADIQQQTNSAESGDELLTYVPVQYEVHESKVSMNSKRQGTHKVPLVTDGDYKVPQVTRTGDLFTKHGFTDTASTRF